MSYLNEKRLGLIYDILRAKRLSSRKFVQYMQRERDYNGEDMLYMREAHLILVIGTEEGKTMSELAKEMDVTHGAITQTVTRLENKGYVTRRRDDNNQRQIIAQLTEKGKEFYKHHIDYDSEEYREMDEIALHRFSDEELEIIREYENMMTTFFTK